MNVASRISNLSAFYRLLISMAVGALTWVALLGHARLGSKLIATWDAFALSALLLAWIIICTTPPQEIRRRVQRQDVAGPGVTIFVIVASCAALLAVVFLLRLDKDAQQLHVVAHVALTLLAVLSSWALVHTVFGLHYAHSFYGDVDGSKQSAGGLQFPGESKPDYLDFAYFSFVVGMTFQVSDVQITSRNLRKLALVHAILAFGFNTVILALTINTVTSLH